MCIARLPGATLHPQPPLHPSKHLAEWCRIVEEWRLFQRGRDGALLLGMADPVPSCQMALPRVRVSRRGRRGLCKGESMSLGFQKSALKLLQV